MCVVCVCVQLGDLSWLTGSAKVPFILVPAECAGKFHMAPPASVDLVGSYPLGTCVKPRITVDLAVTIPAVRHSSDNNKSRDAVVLQ